MDARGGVWWACVHPAGRRSGARATAGDCPPRTKIRAIAATTWVDEAAVASGPALCRDDGDLIVGRAPGHAGTPRG